MARFFTWTSGLLATMLVLQVLVGLITPITSAAVSTSTAASNNGSLSSTTTFSGSVSSTGASFVRPYTSSGTYRYQALQITASSFGTYTFTSSTGSLTQTVGYLYSASFDPTNPSTNLLAYDAAMSAGSGRFTLSATLYSGSTYILVVSTYYANDYGTYGLTASGTGWATMTAITSYTSTYYGYLSSINPTFARPDRSSSSYYYNSVRVTVSSTGSYTFGSRSASSLDTYGCLYDGTFYPSSPSINKLICDDDSGGSLQFLFYQYLYAYRTYTLVITSSSLYVTGSYSVDVTGPSYATLTSITPTAVYLSMVAIIAIVVGSVVFFTAMILIAVACRRRQMVVRQTIISPQYNRTPQNAYYPNVQPYGANKH